MLGRVCQGAGPDPRTGAGQKAMMLCVLYFTVLYHPYYLVICRLENRLKKVS
ncbi:hypothetical protein SCFA_890006 [anaerobic digester metagenome]|uniref:Uncharacterized protein n=1 Tax=anaerobic digester metagenome TaxID=1263854 RepID=A0A485MA69_9ZZZZ